MTPSGNIVIWAFGFGFRVGFGPQNLDLGLEAGGRGGTKKTEKEKEEEKIPHMCESIGHQPLQGRFFGPPSTSSTTYLGRARIPLTI